MDLTLKIFIFWAFLTLLSYIICRVHFKLFEKSWNFNAYMDYSFPGTLCIILFGGGTTAWTIYLLVRLGMWWFG